MSPRFFDTIKALKPYGEAGGNEMLWLVHEFDLGDKHRLLTPIGDFKKITGEIIKRQVPDFPMSGTVGFGMNRRDVLWRTSRSLSREELGNQVPPTNYIFERELDVPVDVVFGITGTGQPRAVIQTVNGMRDAVKEAIGFMKEAVS